MTKIKIDQSLKKLAEIVKWFEEQKEIDIEAGLEKVKEGAKLLNQSKERFKEIKNEFEEVRKTIEID